MFIDNEPFTWVCLKKNVGCIQILHKGLLSLQACGRLWQGCRLVDNTCSHQLIALLDIYFPLRYLYKPYFVDFWLLFIAFTGSAFIDPETCTRLCLHIFCKAYSNWTYKFDFPACLLEVVARFSVVWLRMLSSIDWLDPSQSYQGFIFLVVLSVFSGVEDALIL